MLSVIVPIYNVARYLPECIESILSQDYKNIELILIDDGSTDGSGKICDEYKKNDSRISVYHITNQGVGHARNLGISLAKGKYISFVDSDDYISKNCYKENITILESDDEVGFVQFPIKNKKRNHMIIEGRSALYDSWIYQNKLITNYFWDKIFRSSLLKDLNFPTDMRYEDRYLFSDLLNRVTKVCISDIGWYFYRSHPEQLTKQVSDKLKTDMIKANLHTLSNIPSSSKLSYIRCYWDTFVIFRDLEHTESLDRNLLMEFKKLFPPLGKFLCLRIPIGIKLRLIVMTFKGIN